MKTVTKTLVGTVATLAMAVGSVAPAAAQDRYRDRDRGISTGEIVAGAVVLGGIAAVAAAASNDRDRDYRGNDYRYGDRDYRSGDRNWDGRGSGWSNWDSNRRWGRGNNPQRAVEQCARAAEREIERYGGGQANVTRVNDIDRERGGYEVTGRIQVNTRDYNRGGWGDRGRNNGWNNNRYDSDSGRFYCEYRGGRVVDIDFDGLNRNR